MWTHGAHDDCNNHNNNNLPSFLRYSLFSIRRVWVLLPVFFISCPPRATHCSCKKTVLEGAISSLTCATHPCLLFLHFHDFPSFHSPPPPPPPIRFGVGALFFFPCSLLFILAWSEGEEQIAKAAPPSISFRTILYSPHEFARLFLIHTQDAVVPFSPSQHTNWQHRKLC